jgi:hypothetical protein
MALKKTIAGYLKPDGTWEPQKDINMHPFEEAATLAHWAIHEVHKKMLDKPSLEQEHEWLLEYGAEYVKQKRVEWQKVFDASQPAIQEAEKKWREVEAVWNDHAKKARANGFNPDTHPDARNLTLPKDFKE